MFMMDISSRKLGVEKREVITTTATEGLGSIDNNVTYMIISDTPKGLLSILNIINQSIYSKLKKYNHNIM